MRAHGRGERRLSASSGSTEEAMHMPYGDRALPDGRGDALHRAAAHKPLLVQRNLTVEPRRVRRRPDEVEERGCLQKSIFPAAQVASKNAGERGRADQLTHLAVAPDLDLRAVQCL